MEDTTGPKPRVRRTPRKRVREEGGVRVKSLGASGSGRHRPLDSGQLQGPGQVSNSGQLQDGNNIEGYRRQVRENYAEGAKAIQAARGVWHQRRFAQQVQLTRSIRALTPRGTVGEQVRRQLSEECSACDERTKKNRPEAAKFANKRLKRLTFVPVKPS